MVNGGYVNVGQLVRENRSADGVVLVGCGSYQGSVIAGRAWGDPMEQMLVPGANPNSWEAMLHETLGKDSLLIFSQSEQAEEFFQKIHGHRAIGVVYDPYLDRRGSFVPSALSRRYDAFVYLEQTQALHPLHIEPKSTEPPETYPWGV